MQNQPINLSTDAITLLAIVGGLQLALTHEQIPITTKKIYLDFIASVTPGLCQIDASYGILINAGFNRGQHN